MHIKQNISTLIHYKLFRRYALTGHFFYCDWLNSVKPKKTDWTIFQRYTDITIICVFIFQNMSSSDGMILHILTIGDLDSRDFGDYICMAANKIGSRSEMITVLSKLNRVHFVFCFVPVQKI